MDYHTIWERGGAEVFIVAALMVAELMAEMDENEFAPPLRSSVGGTDA